MGNFRGQIGEKKTSMNESYNLVNLDNIFV